MIRFFWHMSPNRVINDNFPLVNMNDQIDPNCNKWYMQFMIVEEEVFVNLWYDPDVSKVGVFGSL